MSLRSGAVRSLLAAIALAGCTPAGSDDARALDHAVASFRAAENDRKPELAPAVEGAPCTAKEVCRARDACAAMARPTADGLATKRAVQRAMIEEAPQPGSPRALALVTDLERAEARLQEGRAASAGCDEAIRALRRAYRLR